MCGCANHFDGVDTFKFKYQTSEEELTSYFRLYNINKDINESKENLIFKILVLFLGQVLMKV